MHKAYSGWLCIIRTRDVSIEMKLIEEKESIEVPVDFNE